MLYKRRYYGRKQRSFKRSSQSRRSYSRKRVSRSGYSSGRMFHIHDIITDSTINVRPDGTNISIFSAYKMLRNNATFLQYCNMYEQFKLSGMSIKLSNLGGTTTNVNNGVVINYYSMVDRNGQSTGRYNNYADIQSLASSKGGLWTYGGRSVAFESVFAKTMQEKSIYVSTDDIVKITSSASTDVFHALNDQWDPNYLFSLLGPVTGVVYIDLDVKLYVQFRSAREITSSANTAFEINTISCGSSSVLVKNMQVASSSGQFSVPSPGTGVVIGYNNNVYSIKVLVNTTSSSKSLNISQGDRFYAFAVANGVWFQDLSYKLFMVADELSLQDNEFAYSQFSDSLITFQ